MQLVNDMVKIMNIRALKKGDEALLEQFLKQHAETSMFLRSNLQHSGLGYQDSPYHGDYVASFNSHNQINGVIAHFWNGNIMMQTEDDFILDALLTHVKATISRPIAGVLGPGVQAQRVIEQMQIQRDRFAINRDEGLYSVKLSELKAISHPEQHKMQMVEANKISSETLIQWLKDYHIEALGGEDNDALKQQVRDKVSHLTRGMDCWVLCLDGEPRSLVAFNARLPDIVQLGPVWTPVIYRNKGYARMLVLLALKQAQTEGVMQSILFTDNPPAVRAYEALGFKLCDSFRLALLK